MIQYTFHHAPTIALYTTGDSGDSALKTLAHETLAHMGISQSVRIRDISGASIRDDAVLMDDTIIGCIFPGRARGQDYHDQLQPQGLECIQRAVKERGIGVLGICAGSYILSAECWYKNPRDDRPLKRVDNPFPLFEGRTMGISPEFCEQAIFINEDKTVSPLPLSLVHVNFQKAFRETMSPSFSTATAGIMTYWGGGLFLPYHQDNSLQTLVAHHGTFTHQLLNQPVQEITDPAATIAFDCGQGKVMFTNTHLEVTTAYLNNVLKMSKHKAPLPEIFKQNQAEMSFTHGTQKALMGYFIRHLCLQGHAGKTFFENRHERLAITAG